jgi:hypothetical protein
MPWVWLCVKLRARARCICCGSKGATLQRPGWAGNHIGFYAFPHHRRNARGNANAKLSAIRPSFGETI